VRAFVVALQEILHLLRCAPTGYRQAMMTDEQRRTWLKIKALQWNPPPKPDAALRSACGRR